MQAYGQKLILAAKTNNLSKVKKILENEPLCFKDWSDRRRALEILVAKESAAFYRFAKSRSGLLEEGEQYSKNNLIKACGYSEAEIVMAYRSLYEEKERVERAKYVDKLREPYSFDKNIQKKRDTERKVQEIMHKKAKEENEKFQWEVFKEFSAKAVVKSYPEHELTQKKLDELKDNFNKFFEDQSNLLKGFQKGSDEARFISAFLPADKVREEIIERLEKQTKEFKQAIEERNTLIERKSNVAKQENGKIEELKETFANMAVQQTGKPQNVEKNKNDVGQQD